MPDPIGGQTWFHAVFAETQHNSVGQRGAQQNNNQVFTLFFTWLISIYPSNEQLTMWIDTGVSFFFESAVVFFLPFYFRLICVGYVQ